MKILQNRKTAFLPVNAFLKRHIDTPPFFLLHFAHVLYPYNLTIPIPFE